MSRRPVVRPTGQYHGLSSSTFRPPPLSSSLGIPDLYDWHAEHSYDHKLWVFIRSEDGVKREISWAEAAVATRRGAKIVHELVGFHSIPEKRPVVALLSMSDTITYSTTIVSVLRANCVVFPISTRNSPAAVANLLDLVDVRHILVGHDASVQELARQSIELFTKSNETRENPKTYLMPEFDAYFTDGWKDEVQVESPRDYIHPVDNTEALCCLHSSGSTAFPKPIFWTSHKIQQLALSPYYGGRDFCGKLLGIHALPMFHATGVIQTFWPATCGMILSVFEPRQPSIQPTPERLFDAVRAAECDLVVCVPSFIEAWSENPEYIEWLVSTDGIMFGGGPLSTKVGDFLTEKGVTIFVCYGSTEIGYVNPILPSTIGKDWNYFQFTDAIHAEMLPYGNGLYEFIAVETKHMTPSVVNRQVGGKNAYSTSDLLETHPTKKGFWKVFGRTDDQIMHKTGEKTNPGPLESLMNKNEYVQASVMFGRGRLQVGIIVEPKAAFKFDPNNLVKLEQFRTSIWPTVEAMNKIAPQHSRLFKEMIMVTIPTKPFAYTGKGTARRQAIIAEYDEEIEALYASVDETMHAGSTPPRFWDKSSTTLFVRTVVEQVLTTSHTLTDTDDLFQHGCDSLQANWINNALLRALRDSVEVDTRQTTENIVYAHPTIERLALFMVALVNGEHIEAAAKVDEMYEMVEKYAITPSETPMTERESTGEGNKIVLITGTTGSFGCYILEALLRDDSVERVYAVNRRGAGNSKERQLLALKERQLDAGLLDSKKLMLLEVDEYSKQSLHMAKEVTHIIHNAWRVDFNLGLSSFESNVRGLRELIELALSFAARISFVSSVSVFSAAPTDVPLIEAAIDAKYASSLGYGASKWVAEELLRRAAGLHYQVIRVGQLCGAASGFWNVKEWLPAVVQSSRVLGCLPDCDGDISWIPIDTAALVLTRFLDAPNATYHLAHPKPVPWGGLVRVIASKLDVKVVPYSEWLSALKSSNADPTVLLAKKLVPFFETIRETTFGNREAFGLPKVDTTILDGENINVIDRDKILKWAAHWRQVGFI